LGDGSDFESAFTRAEISALYKVVRRIATTEGLTMTAALDQALGSSARGRDYEANFRSGRIAKRNAALIFKWIDQTYPQHRALLEQQFSRLYGVARPRKSWEDFIERNGLFDHAAIIAVPHQPHMPPPAHAGGRVSAGGGMTAVRLRHPRDLQPEMPMFERFRFRLDAPIGGAVLALQWIRGIWSILPLAHGEPGLSVARGEVWLPPDPDQDAPGISVADPVFNEWDEPGLHRFVFLIAPQATIRDYTRAIRVGDMMQSTALNALADRLAAEAPDQWCVLRLNVMFVITDQHAGPAG